MAESANPYDPTYYANLAALNFQKETTLAQDRRGREQASASSRYAKGELTRAAPLRYAANRNQANSQGLLESGQLAQRQGQTQADFANKQSRIAEQRRQAIERMNENDANAEKGYEVNVAKAGAESLQRSQEQLERNPPAPELAPAGVPAAQPPQVVRSTPQARSAAARKVTGTFKRKARGWGVG